jgi:hypothetical protein
MNYTTRYRYTRLPGGAGCATHATLLRRPRSCATPYKPGNTLLIEKIWVKRFQSGKHCNL